MKYIKAYESYGRGLENIEKVQLSKLAILKFAKNFRKLLKWYYDEEMEFNAEEKDYLHIAKYYLGWENSTLIKLMINNDLKIGISLIRNKNIEYMYEFLSHFFNMETYTICNVEQLNKYADTILDEFEIFLNSKKYNL